MRMIDGVIFQADIPIPMDPQRTNSNALKELLPLQDMQLSFNIEAVQKTPCSLAISAQKAAFLPSKAYLPASLTQRTKSSQAGLAEQKGENEMIGT